jgi:hypothetical protein
MAFHRNALQSIPEPITRMYVVDSVQQFEIAWRGDGAYAAGKVGIFPIRTLEDKRLDL